MKVIDIRSYQKTTPEEIELMQKENSNLIKALKKIASFVKRDKKGIIGLYDRNLKA